MMYSKSHPQWIWNQLIRCSSGLTLNRFNLNMTLNIWIPSIGSTGRPRSFPVFVLSGFHHCSDDPFPLCASASNMFSLVHTCTITLLGHAHLLRRLLHFDWMCYQGFSVMVHSSFLPGPSFFCLFLLTFLLISSPSHVNGFRFFSASMPPLVALTPLWTQYWEFNRYQT